MSTPVRRAIYGALSGDSTLTGMLGAAAPGYTKAIYHNRAPANAPFPFLILQKQAGTPTGTHGLPTAFKTDVWLIKAVDRNTTADPAEAIASRLNTLLNDASLSISGATLLYLRRQSDVEYPEDIDGVDYQHVGALYRVIFE